MHLTSVVAEIESTLESEGGFDSVPVTESRSFDFVSDEAIREIIESDYSETQRAFVAHCWKSVIILSGGMIEAVLLDQLLQNEDSARAVDASPEGSDLRRWSLNDLIKVSVEIEVVNEGVSVLSHSVRGYRNLVHPGNQLRNSLSANEEEARIALEVLHMVHRDLS